MAHNANMDLTEEDAADLQFPKEKKEMLKTLNMNVDNDSNNHIPLREFKTSCSNCLIDLVAPHFFCVECKIPICSHCFCNGVEFSVHKNDHNYQILKDTFVLFENSDWTAKEEITMLKAILRYGNWNAVANELPKRTLKEVKDHYDYFYLKRKGSNLLPKIKETQTDVFAEPIVPYRLKINNTEDPPRFQPNTSGYSAMAGYNPARSDFEYEYDTSAEDLLSNLKPIDESDPHYSLMTKLQCAIIESYNRRLRERQRWKAIMRKHGLILTRKCLSWLSRYDITITKPVYMKLIRFMQLCEPEHFEFILEGLHRIGELKLHISRLCDFRSKGITTLGGAQLYLKLKNQHEEYKKDLKLFQKQSRYNWKQVQPNVPSATEFFVNKRRPAFAPLDILGMPGYEKLSVKEMDLCSTVRLTPTLYFELKNLLVAENKKMGHLKLQTARRLLKIDVNKTRKLYDYLVEEGFITKP